MDLCAWVSEGHRDGEGVVLQELSRLSLDTHRREVVGAYDVNIYTQKTPKTPSQLRQKSRGHVGTAAAGGQEPLLQPGTTNNPGF